MERKGFCKRCGKCCQTYFLYKDFSLIDKIIIRIKIILAGKKFDIKDKCKYLYFKKGKAICKQYNSRPEFCKRFPDNPTDIVDGCGFSIKGE